MHLRRIIPAAVVVAVALAEATAAAEANASHVHVVARDEMLGAACQAQSDCGFLPGLACMKQ